MSNFSDVMDYFGLNIDEVVKVLNVLIDEIVCWCNMDDSLFLYVWQGVICMLDDVCWFVEEVVKLVDLDCLDVVDLN